MPSIIRAAEKNDDHGLAVATAQSLAELLSASPPLPSSVVDFRLLPIAMSALDSALLTPLEDKGQVGAEWLHFLLVLTGRLQPQTIEGTVLPWALKRGEVRALLLIGICAGRCAGRCVVRKPG